MLVFFFLFFLGSLSLSLNRYLGIILDQFCKSLGCSFSDRFPGNNASKTLSDRIESENCHQNSRSIEFIIALNDSQLQSSKSDLYDVGMVGIPYSLGSIAWSLILKAGVRSLDSWLVSWPADIEDNWGKHSKTLFRGRGPVKQRPADKEGGEEDEKGGERGGGITLW